MNYRRTISLNNDDLARLHKVFATIRPGWSQRVEVIYTFGKTDNAWAKGGVAPEEEGTAGVTVSTNVDERLKALTALVAIDLNYALLPEKIAKPSANRISQMTPAVEPVPEDKRERVFFILQHELLHVLQAWNWGNDWGNMYAQGGSNYGQNRYEQAARRHGLSWVKDNQTQLASGAYDRFAPIEDLRRDVARK
jgi:hypothetical protein